MIRNWSNLNDVEVIIRYSSTMNILGLESVDETAGVARTSLPGTYARRRLQRQQRNPSVWVENVLEVLDHPGAWVLNTHTRKLYPLPRTEEPKGILAPRLRELIRVEGKNEAGGTDDVTVRNLIFRGLTFAHADRDIWSEGDIGIQHDWEMFDKRDALLRLRGAEKCEGNEIRYMGQGGIMLIGYGPGFKDVNKQNEILNTYIHHCG